MSEEKASYSAGLSSAYKSLLYARQVKAEDLLISCGVDKRSARYLAQMGARAAREGKRFEQEYELALGSCMRCLIDLRTGTKVVYQMNCPDHPGWLGLLEG